MAQNFAGSNNINLLYPSGQFGTCQMGGKDHASGRYIYTKLTPIPRHLFNKADELLLNYLSEDGQSIEPTWYLPIIPMVLVNGSEGIRTGWNTVPALALPNAESAKAGFLESLLNWKWTSPFGNRKMSPYCRF
ncbi:DNA topoisomerase 2-like [Lactuca sativa]|uniref:DNA topoisomerase 2-like n=1 Tax=Lactuca sativa TaxID=4236 RepID=UPI0022AEC8EA|nr:DNA topoisomerase 2-like [Lactuca sativa]